MSEVGSEHNTASGALRRPVRLTFANGGWTLWLAVLFALVVAWRLLDQAGVFSGRQPLKGDGKHLESYGFELSPLLVPRERITPAVPKDKIRALTEPATLPGSGIARYNKDQAARYERKFLVEGDRVLGVVIRGEARAYPLNVLCWHDVCNDTLAGTPLLVSYNALCDSVMVAGRAIDGETLEFGVSGLLYNSNLLLYDKRPEQREESLWSQLQLRAVAGPACAAGRTLTPLPCELTHWADWYRRYPATTVCLGDPDFGSQYNANPYGPYFETEKLRFPVEPPPDPAGAFSRVLAVRLDGRWEVVPYAEIKAKGGQSGSFSTDNLVYHYIGMSQAMDPETAYVTLPDGSPGPPSLSCLRFAWDAVRAQE